MSETATKTLLPEGLRDVLPPDAAFETAALERLMRTFAQNGYELVKPPLIEFEDTLVAGVGAGMGGRIFRMLDPASNRTLGVRSDITTQVARIAATRLARAPRPLRLTYAGPVLRVKGSQLDPERQFTQAGIELIGPEAGPADAEAIIVTVEALQRLGVTDVSVDLALPTLVPAIFRDLKIGEEVAGAVRGALDHKDVAEIAARAKGAAPLLNSLIEASGPLDTALLKIDALALPPGARAEWLTLVGAAKLVRAALPKLAITVDAVENRGFEYHTGLTFSVFAAGSQREIGRGGRYRLPSGEAATGATLFVDAVLPAVPPATAPRKVYAPRGTTRAEIVALQDQGWAVVAALMDPSDIVGEARRLGCTHALKNGAPAAL
jgi:ATP phosphoribosyltransferase regulatory subunit